MVAMRINAALTEKRIKAVVSITGVNIRRLFGKVSAVHDPIGALNAMASQRTKEARGELQINELLFPPASWMQQSPWTDRTRCL